MINNNNQEEENMQQLEPLLNRQIHLHINEIHSEIKSTFDQQLKERITEEDNESQIRANEAYFISFISNGDVDALDSFLDYVKKNGIRPSIAKAVQDNDRPTVCIFAISYVTRFCQASINAGVPEALASALNECYMDIIKKDDNNLEHIAMIPYVASKGFAEIVHDWVITNQNPAIRTCYSYIFTHIQEPITLEKLSQACNLSPNYVSDLFKKELDIRPIAFVRKLKLQASRFVLTRGNRSVSEIAELFAFPSASAYTTQFREEYGITPLQYRKNPSSVVLTSKSEFFR